MGASILGFGRVVAYSDITPVWDNFRVAGDPDGAGWGRAEKRIARA
jgi:hypothetical protein